MCKLYQTKCKTRYGIFKILGNDIYSENWSRITTKNNIPPYYVCNIWRRTA